MNAMQKDLYKLRKTAQTVGSGLNKALAGAGLSIGLVRMTHFLKESARASAEDTKSKNQLALALRNTLGATKETTDAAEKFIQRTSNSVAVLDDDLRPALATAVRATGSLSKATRFLDTALDVSAGTGKDLSSVTNAMAKAYNGNYGALKKLLPSIKTGADFMSQLDGAFKGAAEQAAMDDPYKALQVIFDNFKETIGNELLPALQKFYEYLKSPDGQAQLKTIARIFIQIAQGAGAVLDFVLKNIIWIKALAAAIITVKVAIGLMTFAMKIYDLTTKIATVSTKALKYALITTGIGALVVGISTLVAAVFEYSDAADAAKASTEEMFAELDLMSPEMKLAIEAYKDAVIEIDTLNNQVFADGILVFDQAKFDENKRNIQDAADSLKKALQDKIKGIKETAEKFRDSVGLAFGVFGKDENSVFNADVVINKMKRMVEAAKGFAKNIKELRKKGATQDVISEIVGMGPAQGNIVAKGLLGSGSLQDYLNLRKSLYNTGASVGAEAAIAGDATYNIKVEGTALKASDIIAEIRKYEKANGRKYLLNG
jgi:hypothetical protein